MRLVVLLALGCLVSSCASVAVSPLRVPVDCPPLPAAAFVGSELGPAEVDDVWSLLVFGGTTPDVFPKGSTLLNIAASDAEVRQYLRCKAANDPRANGAMHAYVLSLAAFMEVGPSHAQFVRWKCENMPHKWQAQFTALAPNWSSSAVEYDSAATRFVLREAESIIAKQWPLALTSQAISANHALSRLVSKVVDEHITISTEATEIVAASGAVLFAVQNNEVSTHYASDELGRLMASMRTLALLELPTTTPAGASKGPWEYVVWYGTNRIAVSVGGSREFFNESRPSNGIELGTCTVYIPESHEVGSTGSSSWSRILKWSDDRIKILNIKSSDAEAWTAAAAEALRNSNSGGHDAVVYVHGYNNDFEEAARRAAQIGFDLGVDGVMAFFSWPSRGEESEYLADVEAVQASERAFEKFLTAVSSIPGVERVHVIAHSMGNVALLRVVSGLKQASSMKFGQIILAAPDVDVELFRQLAVAYPQACERTTLYVSPKDKAVWLSQWLRGRDRAGYSPPQVCMDGIDTVEFAGIDLYELGHGYFAEARPVLQDIWSIVHSGKGPKDRFGLREMKTKGGDRYWCVSK